MNYNSYKLIPKIHGLGNYYMNDIYRNYRFYSILFFNNYIIPIKHQKCTIYLSNIIKTNLKGTNGHYFSTQISDFVDPCKLNLSTSSNTYFFNDNNSTQSFESTSLDNTNDIFYLIANNRLREMNEYIFETIDKSILSNLDNLSVVNISNLIQLTMKNFYSQNLIEALILKLQTTDPSDLQVSSLSVIIQNLGRIQPCDFELERLKGFFDKVCDHLVKIEPFPETYFSSIIYGFQRLHYYNPEFLKNATKRYNRDFSNVNINSLIISLSSLVKFNFYDIGIILNIYKVISKGISHMTLQTTIQLITTIPKIHDYYNPTNILYTDKLDNNTEFVSEDKRTKLNKQNYKLMNYMLKNICSNYLDNLNIVQTSLIFNSINKLGFRKTGYLSKLIQTIPSNFNINLTTDGTVLEDENSDPDLIDIDISNEESNSSVNNDVLALKSTIDESLGSINNSSSKDNRHKERNIFSYKTLPDCPFNYEMTFRKLQNVDPSNLILISDAIFGLEYYTDYSLNLMFIIKEIVNPILHELKSNKILMHLLSFSNIHFTNYQVQRLDLGKLSKKKSVSRKQVKLLLDSLSKFDNKGSNWFNPDHLINNNYKDSIVERFDESQTDETNEILLNGLRNALNKSEWKEELVLNSFENLLRHVSYIKGSHTLLKKFKLIISLLMNDIYLPNCQTHFNLSHLQNIDNSDQNGYQVKEPQKFPAIIPENIIEILYGLYSSPIRHGDIKLVTDGREEYDEIIGNDLEQIEYEDDFELSDSAKSDEVVDYVLDNENVETNDEIKVNGKTIYIDKNVVCFKVPIIVTFDNSSIC